MTAGNNTLLIPSSSSNKFLVGNPNYTYFKKIYNRYTNFESVYKKIPFTEYKLSDNSFVPIINKNNINFGKTISCKINCESGFDLLSNLYLYINLPIITNKFISTSETVSYHNSVNELITKTYKKLPITTNNNSIKSDKKEFLNEKYMNQNKIISWTNSIGFAIIDFIEIKIGNNIIDKHTGAWLNIWYEMSGKKNGYIGKYSENEWLTKGIYLNALEQKLVIPLQFYFCKEIGLALPLVAIRDDIEITLKFNEFIDCIFNRYLNKETQKISKEAGPYGCEENFSFPTKNIEDAYLIGHFIKLDTDEKAKFKNTPHEYIVEQLQIVKQSSYNYSASFDSSGNLNPKNIDLYPKLKNPVKMLVWVTLMDNKTNVNDFFVYHDSLPININTDSLLTKGKIVNKLISENSEGLSDILDHLYSSDFHGDEDYSQSICDKIKNLIFTTDNQINGKFNSIIKKMSIEINGEFIQNDFDFNVINESIESINKRNTMNDSYIQSYSFALDPLNTIPSGMVNFNNVNSSKLVPNLNNNLSGSGKIYVYAISYNVLKIIKGDVGLVY